MWIKSDKWGTLNWGQLSQATDNVALLPDLSGTIIESNAVVFDGAGMFIRRKGAGPGSNDLATEFKWGAVLTCNANGGGLGADCNGYPQNAVRYDTPTWGGFSLSTSYGEDDMWDIALKYAADWNSIKVSAAAGWTQITDEGCIAPATCTNIAVVGGGGAPFQGYRQDGQLFQVGASILHVPSGLFVYGLFQDDQEDGTQFRSVHFNGNPLLVNNFKFRTSDSNANDSTTWFVKAGIKRTFTPLGATVLWGEWGQYNDMFRGLCGLPGPANINSTAGNTFCATDLVVGGGDLFKGGAFVNGSEVTRFGAGIMQEIDAAAMHVFARWQHMDLDLDAIDARVLTLNKAGLIVANEDFGKRAHTSFEGLDIFQIGGVIFY
jgi:hypothetical protein